MAALVVTDNRKHLPARCREAIFAEIPPVNHVILPHIPSTDTWMARQDLDCDSLL